jgi:hypothetical protein
MSSEDFIEQLGKLVAQSNAVSSDDLYMELSWDRRDDRYPVGIIDWDDQQFDLHFSSERTPDGLDVCFILLFLEEPQSFPLNARAVYNVMAWMRPGIVPVFSPNSTGSAVELDGVEAGIVWDGTVTAEVLRDAFRRLFHSACMVFELDDTLTDPCFDAWRDCLNDRVRNQVGQRKSKIKRANDELWRKFDRKRNPKRTP